MAHRFGALTLPAPAVAPGESVTDPGLDVLGGFFRAILEKYLATAWASVAPGEPIVRVVSTDNPEERDFTTKDLPLLCLWRPEDSQVNHLTEVFEENQDLLRILWVPAITTHIKGHVRSTFFNGFKKAISLAVRLERDPVYVHPVDAARAASDPLRQAAEAYGSDVHDLAGLDWWRLRNFTRMPVDFPVGNHSQSIPGYLATLQIGETNETDFSNDAWGTARTKIALDITSGGPDPDIRQSAIVTGPFSADFSLAFDGGVPGAFASDFSEEFH